MKKGYSKKVDSLFRFLENEEIDNIKEYIASDAREYLEYKNVDAIDFFNEDYRRHGFSQCFRHGRCRQQPHRFRLVRCHAHRL